MTKAGMAIALCLVATIGAGCMSRTPATGQSSVSGQQPGLVGAWIVESARAGGLGMNMLTFSSDGTFFRSGDTHPVLSGAHGAWKKVSETEYHASYIAFRFDNSGKWNGFARTRIQVIVGPDGNTFTGLAKSSARDLQDKELGTGESKLVGKRITVEPF
jgi:hypothetical protein